MKKILLVFGALLYFVGICYLLLPSPAYPDLSRSIRSNEPGDTWQHPDQKGYYTDLHRNDVISEMRSKFSLSFLGIAIPNMILNYPPENAQILVRDQLKSNYLQEIIYPMRESLIVNGWEPENDPKQIRLDPKKRSELYADGINYFSKITLKPVISNGLARVIIWTLIFPATFLTFKSLKSSVYA